MGCVRLGVMLALRQERPDPLLKMTGNRVQVNG